MATTPNGILIISPTISPNIGGVETHLDDLMAALDRCGYSIYAHAYSPITTPGVAWKSKEKRGHIQIWRYRWFGKTLLHKIEKNPILDFLYITPYLFIRVFFFMIFNQAKIDIIHAQGFNAAFIGNFLKKIFKKKLIVSTHAVYEIDPASKTASRMKKIINGADKVLALSDSSLIELLSIGVDQQKLGRFFYWIDLAQFKILGPQEGLRARLNWSSKFTVLFVGRLTEIKGVKILIQAAEALPQIQFVFVGTGPLEDFLNKKSKEKSNILFMGPVENKELLPYYNAADLFCIPSQYAEGYGRVIMEAVACGLPVVGARLGGIPEALNDTVSLLVEPTRDNLIQAISKLSGDKTYYQSLKNNCRSYAEDKFSETNVKAITDSYK